MIFACGGLFCFLLTVVYLYRRGWPEDPRDAGSKAGYELVNGQKKAEDISAKEKEASGIKT